MRRVARNVRPTAIGARRRNTITVPMNRGHFVRVAHGGTPNQQKRNGKKCQNERRVIHTATRGELEHRFCCAD